MMKHWTKILIPLLVSALVFASVPGAAFAAEPQTPVPADDGMAPQPAASGVTPDGGAKDADITGTSDETSDSDPATSADDPNVSDPSGSDSEIEPAGETNPVDPAENPGESGDGANGVGGADTSGNENASAVSPEPSGTVPPGEDPADGSGEADSPDTTDEPEKADDVDDVNALADAVNAGEPVEILVVMKDTVNEEAVVAETDEIVAVEPLGADEKFAVIEAAAENVETAIAEYERDPNVEYAQPNYPYMLLEADSDPGQGGVTSLGTPSDPDFSKQWALQEDFAMGMNAAWDIVPPGSGRIRVGVLDTGVQIQHPDLAANINTSIARNVTDDTADVTDTSSNGHGTHVAGILAADTDNSLGVAGASNDFVEIVPIKIFTGSGASMTSSTQLMTKGIEYAIAQECKIINISAGSSPASLPTAAQDLILKTAIDKAVQQGVLVIAAAGNDGNKGEVLAQGPVFPSDYTNVVSVTATNKNNVRAGYSSYNNNKNIAAPGGDGASADQIYSTIPNAYGYLHGTSMAAPYVAAAAALVWTSKPGLTAVQVEQILYNTATDLGPVGKDPYYGYGLVNASEALDAALGCIVVFQNYDGSVLKSEIIREGQATVPPADPVRPGYTFTGWDSAAYTSVTTDLTITAQFSPTQYAATFNANSGLISSAPVRLTVTYDSPIGALPVIAPPTGYTFTGWYATPGGGARITPDTIWETEGDATFYAQFSPNQYIATFNANSGLISRAPVRLTVTYDSPVGALPVIAPPSGYAFTGWYATPGGGTQITSDTIWKTAGDATFYARYTAVPNTWVQDDAGNWYYIGQDGEPVKGWQTVDGKRRYFDHTTGVVGKGVIKISGKWYYFPLGSKGVFTTGLKTVSGKTYYFGSDGKARTGWQTVNGKKRYFDKKTAAAPIGAVKISGKFYGFKKSSKGVYMTGMQTIDGKTYYFGSDGKAKTGWQTVNGKKRYFDKKTGAAPIGVVKISGKWHYFTKGSKGSFMKGLKTVDGNVYYFGPDGKAKTGWQKVSGKDRYFDKKTAAAPKGWTTIAWKTYYFPPNGKGSFYAGYKEIDGYYYLFNSKGHMYRSTTVTEKGWRYVIDENGHVISRTKGESGFPKGAPPVKGIDVSYAQGGNIDWDAVKASGVKFAIIRAGYTDWIGTCFQMDSTYIHNVREAQERGILVGTYLYVYSRDIEEQKKALADFHKKNEQFDIALDLPVFLDIEDDRFYLPSTDSLGGNAYRTKMLQSGLDQLRSQGYDAGFYASLNWADTKFDTEKLVSEGNAFWLACWYGNNAEMDAAIAAWNGRYPAVWQYRSTGSVPGISGNVDMNWLYPGNMP